MDLRDKHVLVTGGSKGVGAALVRMLRANSARVTIAARQSKELEQIVSESGAIGIPIDLSDFSALDGYIKRVEAESGSVDILINNAALVGSGTIWQLSADNLRRQLDTNLLAPMELCRQVLPGMVERGHGLVVNVSSMVAELSIPNLPAYVASKAGLSKFSDDLESDLRRTGTNVRSALVVLGEIPGTQINAGFREDQTVARLADTFANLPVLTPEKAAQGIVELIQSRKRSLLILPGYNAPIVYLRKWPIWLTSKLAG